MPRGGSRSGAGRKKVLPELPESAPTKTLAAEILDSLGAPEWKCPRKCFNATCEVCLWRTYAIKDRSALEYLWNRRDGRPVQQIKYDHDKPIDVNLTVKLSEIVRAVRERKLEYERSRG